MQVRGLVQDLRDTGGITRQREAGAEFLLQLQLQRKICWNRIIASYFSRLFITKHNVYFAIFLFLFLETHNPRESGLIAFGWYVGIGISQSCPGDSTVEDRLLGGEKHVPPESMVNGIKIYSLQAKRLK